MSEPIARYKNLNYSVALYPNRVEISQTVVPLVPPQVETILLRNVASVDIPFGKRMEIKTADGKKHVVNLAANDARDLRAKMADLL